MAKNPDKADEYAVPLSAQGVEGVWYLCKAARLRHQSERKSSGRIVRGLKVCGAMVPAAEGDEFNFRYRGGFTVMFSENAVKFLEDMEERLHKSQEGFAAQYAESVDVMWEAIDEVRDRVKFEQRKLADAAGVSPGAERSAD